LKKVIIVSYFYSPSNFVGAERTKYWAENLYKSGVYPIIITRNWNNGQKDIVDKVNNNELRIEKKGNYEIHYLPYHQNLRDKLSDYPYLKIIQKFLSLLELIFSNFFISFIPYSNFYNYIEKLISKDKEINVVISSGRPFQSFFFGYKLKKKFNYLNWIPDYRDEWNTHQNNHFQTGILGRFLKSIEQKSERKWTSNATFFISVSDYWANSISKFIERPGLVVKNGYDELNYLEDLTEDNTLKILYAGTMYPSQDISIFINACNKLIESQKALKLEVVFIGVEMVPEVVIKLKELTKNNKEHFLFHNRMSKVDLNEEIKKADLLLLTGFNEVKGWYPVKLFQYYSTGKPILMIPSDNGVMQDFIEGTKSGYIADSEEECLSILNKLIDLKVNSQNLRKDTNTQFGEHFSREYQTKLLGEKLILLK
jgi:glycosyltransferase involved in cell wall biosynthesis